MASSRAEDPPPQPPLPPPRLSSRSSSLTPLLLLVTSPLNSLFFFFSSSSPIPFTTMAKPKHTAAGRKANAPASPNKNEKIVFEQITEAEEVG